MKPNKLKDLAVDHAILPSRPTRHPRIFNCAGVQIIMSSYLSNAREECEGVAFVVLGSPGCGKSFAGMALTNCDWGDDGPQRSLTINLRSANENSVVDKLVEYLHFTTKKNRFDPEELVDHIIQALVADPSPTMKQKMNDQFDSLDLLGCGNSPGGTMSADSDDAQVEAGLKQSHSTSTVTAASTVSESSTADNLPELLGRKIERRSKPGTKQDKRPVLFINDINFQASKDSKFWSFLTALVTAGEEQRITTYLTTNLETIANHLYAINGGNKVKPLPALKQSCTEAAWLRTKTPEEVQAYRHYMINTSALPTFLWKPFDFAINEKYDLFQHKFPELGFDEIKDTVDYCVDRGDNLSEIARCLCDL